MDSTLACLAAWMPRQRWYSARGRPPALRLIGSWDLASSDPTDVDVRIRTLLVVDDGSLPAVLYQVPVVARSTDEVDAEAAHIIGSPEPGTTLIDGPFDPAYAAALLRMVTRGGIADGARTIARGHPAAGSGELSLDLAAAPLTGEQSNTSLIYRSSDPHTIPIICKVFRQLHAGINPDIELQTALAASGSPHVPRAIGSVEGEWPDPREPRESVSGSLAFAQQFLPGVEDAWRVALHAASTDDDFSDRAHALGVATAEVHVRLAELFGARATSEPDHDEVRRVWRRRLTTATAEVPGIADSVSAIEAVYERADRDVWPEVQRVHGDYHLGQVILVPGHGWVLLDFEGEPMRPMAERLRPDLALRDVAGMLRSFDYVAGSIRLERTDSSLETVRSWADDARTSFLQGYATSSGVDLRAVKNLLDALELDKAVYEAIYEARNRPTWVDIPLRAIRRLTAPV